MTRRTATLVWAAMLVVPFAFLGVVATTGRDVAAPELTGPLFLVAALASAANVVLSRALPPRLGAAGAHDPDAVAFTRLLVSLALCEAAALAPLVAYLLTRDRRLLGVLALALLALVLLFPSDRRWAALAPGRAHLPRGVVR